MMSTNEYQPTPSILTPGRLLLWAVPLIAVALLLGYWLGRWLADRRAA